MSSFTKLSIHTLSFLCNYFHEKHLDDYIKVSEMTL